VTPSGEKSLNASALVKTILPLPSSPFADEGGAAVGIDRQLPHLKLFGGDLFDVPLREGDFVQKPIGSGGIRHILCPAGKGDVRPAVVLMP
jgi:hypothetical protein